MLVLLLAGCGGSASGLGSGSVAAGPALVDGRPVLGDGEQLVLDVSVHQADIDWKRVARDGIAGAYVKASEGGDFRDKRFDRNWSELRRAGLRRGAYHFFTFCRHGTEQAANFLAAAPPATGSLPPAVDVETSGNCALRPSPEDLRSELAAFLRPVEAAWGQRVVLYASFDVQAVYGLAAALNVPEWERSLGRRPAGDWLLWQASAAARVDGVQGDVDINVLRAG